MSQPMLSGGFEWNTAQERRKSEWQGKTVEQKVGYFRQARILYHVDLHEAHKDDPLEAER